MALGCALSACGGGGGSGGSPAPTAAAATPLPVTAAVNTWGDSTMVGWMADSAGVFSITQLPSIDMQADLQTQFGSGVTVTTNAVGGTTLQEALIGNSALYPQSLVQVLAAHGEYRVILENYGINDRAATTPAYFEQELTQFIASVEGAGRVPVLEEPNPLCDPSKPPANNVEFPGDAQGDPVILPYVQAVDDVAARYGVPLVKTYYLDKQLPNWCALLSDGEVHPGPVLAQYEAKNRAAVLAPIVSNLAPSNG
jgi:acyl-CoA thioesterase-1